MRVEVGGSAVSGFCAVWSPRAATLAFALTGDGERARRIAGRAVVRAVAHWRDIRNPYALEAWFNKTVVAMSLRAHIFDAVMRRSRPPDRPDGLDDSSRRLWDALHRLRFKTRAALVLVHFIGLNESQAADSLGTSVAGVRSLVSHGIEAWRPGEGPEVVGAELRNALAAIVERGVTARADLEPSPRRVGAARMIGALEAIVLVAGVAGGGYLAATALTRERPESDRGRDVVELDDRDRGAPPVQVGAPAWCPEHGGMQPLPDETVDGRTGTGQTFVVALTKRYADGFKRYTDSVMIRIDGSRGPHPSRWPRLPEVSSLRIVHQGPGGGDFALRDACGALVARRSWIIVYENLSEPEPDQLAIYLLRRAGEWKVWGTYEPALIL